MLESEVNSFKPVDFEDDEDEEREDGEDEEEEEDDHDISKPAFTFLVAGP